MEKHCYFVKICKIDKVARWVHLQQATHNLYFKKIMIMKACMMVDIYNIHQLHCKLFRIENICKLGSNLILKNSKSRSWLWYIDLLFLYKNFNSLLLTVFWMGKSQEFYYAVYTHNIKGETNIILIFVYI